MKAQADRSNAEGMFVRQGLKLDEIAAKGIASRGALARWSKQGDWQRKREDFRRGPQAALDALKTERANLISALATASEEKKLAIVDGIQKLTATLDSMERRSKAIETVLSVMEDFARFVSANTENDAAALEMMRVWLDKFLDHVRTENV